MKCGKIFSLLFYFAGFVGLFFYVGCADTEDTESSDSVVLPSELYDTSQLTYDISGAEVQELMQLDVPENWRQTRDPELHAKYYHAQLLKQFGNIPAVHIVAAHNCKRQLGISTTVDEQITYAKAMYVLWPNESNLRNLEMMLKVKLRRETDAPELFAKLYREELVEQHGDIPEVDTVVEGETKLWFGGFIFPGDEDAYIAFLEAEYVLWPDDLKLQIIQKYRKARAEGTPFQLVDESDDN